MTTTDLQGVVEQVVRRAKRQSYVVPRDIRDELSYAGFSDSLWKRVAGLARPALTYRHGRYYFAVPVSPRVLQEQRQQREIQKAVRQLVRAHRAPNGAAERRGQNRVDFIQPVKVVTDDGREFKLLSRDLSASGIRLVGTCRLLGQKVDVQLPSAENGVSYTFRVSVLWTCAIGDDLFENGGTFIGVSSSPPDRHASAGV